MQLIESDISLFVLRAEVEWAATTYSTQRHQHADYGRQPQQVTDGEAEFHAAVCFFFSRIVSTTDKPSV